MSSQTTDIEAGIKECWREYPKAQVGISLLTFGIHGVTRKKRRNDCIARVRKTGGKSSDAEYLWSIPEPWIGREPDPFGAIARFIGLKTGGDAIRSMALGRRPSSKFIDIERKATIIGGIQALGIVSPIWSSLSSSVLSLPSLRLQGDDLKGRLLPIVQEGAAAEGQSVEDLRSAQEYIRRRVIAEGLGSLAWSARGLALTTAAANAEHKRQQVESIVGSALGVASIGATATVIGAPVGLVLGGLSAGVHTLANRTSVEETRANGLADQFANDFAFELELYGIQQQIEQVEQRQAELALLEREALLEGRRTAQIIQASVWLGAAGVLYYGWRRWQSPVHRGDFI